MLRILEGVRVIDMTSVVLGPYATQMLGDLGADVIKVESSAGDIFRYVAPSRHPGMGAGFLNLNRNKRSMQLNLKTEKGRVVFDRLVENADVLIHNMRPAAVTRLDIGFDRLHALNPRLIYCTAVGFGGDGPYADRPAYDDIVQAISGMAWLDSDTNVEPRFVPTIVADKVAALFAVQGVLAALFNRERTGKGVAVEAPMFESLANFILAEHMAGRVFDTASGKVGYERLLNAFHRPYRTLDGYIAVLPYSARHWKAALIALGRQDLAVADWVVDDSMRSQRIAELYEVLAQCLSEKTTAEWLECFQAHDIPCANVNRLKDLFHDEHLKAVNFFQHYSHPTEGHVTNTRYPLRFVGADEKPDLPVPGLGQETKEILTELGFGPDETGEQIK